LMLLHWRLRKVQNKLSKFWHMSFPGHCDWFTILVAIHQKIR
jgi:hypothetical protein